ncbi:DUF4388 domain-containing protein [Deinococcus sonorensis]|uniref:DUF4388 domain-containing protein n=2 Tax=Deinococcus sonorensis TaxID=309891 RepID=A0AAU7U8J2_9DEIO
MTKTTATLETFDFLELLVMLAEGRRTGVLRVFREHEFQAWLRDGRIMHLQFGELVGVPALVALLSDPRGHFNFDENLLHPAPLMDHQMEDVALEALASLPVPDLVLQGPARIAAPERVARMSWSLREENVLREVAAGTPLSQLSQDPQARQLLGRLARLGLLVARRSRVARLTVAMTHEVQGVGVVNESILRRWREDVGKHVSHVAVRDTVGEVHSVPVVGSASAAALLLLPPELMLRTQMHAGDAVLVRPL